MQELHINMYLSSMCGGDSLLKEKLFNIKTDTLGDNLSPISTDCIRFCYCYQSLLRDTRTSMSFFIFLFPKFLLDPVILK